MTNSKVSVDQQIKYITTNVNEMTRNELRDILQIIVNSNIPDHLIHEKGDGTLVRFKDIANQTIASIYNYMHVKLTKPLTETLLNIEQN